ncbi:type II toxin-antitoxin system RelE/ParE family toxin [Chlorobium sp. N1]|uniref:type II toxin-antitoxin system RelE/ParE family toxin n=1 Tax=Chlorobium sp. N1 TaxID=2491138 RepID=UPI0010388340|nr:type II toxin-antitoxin system RelE/ParE family toxin [Chlorobium sp. N1]TCD47559.1 type II toxin-antitoxin system RelE/ParE family toxin [Chlorobium sp. N1]
MGFDIEYFHPSIEATISGWPVSVKADYRRISLLLTEYGPQVRMPNTKALGSGLFEMRPKGRDGIGRAFYCYVKGKKIIVLHAFIKKTQKTPLKEMRLARKRLEEVR